MADPSTGPKLIRLEGGDRFDEFREALTALELASLQPADQQAVTVVREVIASLEKRLAEHANTEALSA
jgi:hypothetical protein